MRLSHYKFTHECPRSHPSLRIQSSETRTEAGRRREPADQRRSRMGDVYERPTDDDLSVLALRSRTSRGTRRTNTTMATSSTRVWVTTTSGARSNDASRARTNGGTTRQPEN